VKVLPPGHHAFLGASPAAARRARTRAGTRSLGVVLGVLLLAGTVVPGAANAGADVTALILAPVPASPVLSGSISVLPPDLVVPSGSTNAPGPPWTLLLNDDATLPGYTVWQPGDHLYISVAPNGVVPGGNDAVGANFIGFASTPTVTVGGGAFGATAPTFTVSTVTYPGDNGATQGVGLHDVLDIKFTNTGGVPGGLTPFIIGISNVRFTTGVNTTAGPIATFGGYVSGVGGGSLVLPAAPPNTALTFVASATPPLPPSPSPPPPPTVPIQRVFGLDALGTAIAVSVAEFPLPGSASSVVLARSEHYADALAGGPLAGAKTAPLLITPGAALSSGLDPRVLGEIQRVLPTGHTVYLLGGALALAPGIDTALQGAGYSVQRVAGANEFATAVAVANQLGNPDTVFEATGLGFADALSAVPAAIGVHGAILLTNGSAQAPETAAYLAAHPPGTRYAIGGPLAAAGADPSASAVFGPDLFATSAAVAARFFPSVTTFGAATGANFPDALSGGVFMGTPTRVGPVLLVNPSAPLPSSIASYLAGQTHVARGYVFGGPLAIGADVLTALQTAPG